MKRRPCSISAYDRTHGTGVDDATISCITPGPPPTFDHISTEMRGGSRPAAISTSAPLSIQRAIAGTPPGRWAPITPVSVATSQCEATVASAAVRACTSPKRKYDIAPHITSPAALLTGTGASITSAARPFIAPASPPGFGTSGCVQFKTWYEKGTAAPSGAEAAAAPAPPASPSTSPSASSADSASSTSTDKSMMSTFSNASPMLQ